MLSEQAVFSANYIQRENYRYWLYKYIQSLPLPRIFPARVVSIGQEKAFVHLPDFCFDAFISPGELSGLKEESPCWVEITQAQPRKGQLHLRCVPEPAQVTPAEDLTRMIRA